MNWLMYSHALVLAIGVLLPISVQAQTSADPIPRELALALLASVSNATALNEHAPAQGLPADVIPRSATVLGGITSGRSGLTVIRLPYSGAAAGDSLRKSLSTSGWSTAFGRPVQEAGFIPEGSRGMGRGGAALESPTQFCRGTDVVSFNTGSPGANAAIVVIRHQNNQPICSGVPSAPGARAINPMPRLAAHASAAHLGGMRSLAELPDQFISDQRVENSVPLTELMNHYSAQIVAQGWVAIDSATGSNLMSRTFRLQTAANGRSSVAQPNWICTLTGFTTAAQKTEFVFWGRRR